MKKFQSCQSKKREKQFSQHHHLPVHLLIGIEYFFLKGNFHWSKNLSRIKKIDCRTLNKTQNDIISIRIHLSLDFKNQKNGIIQTCKISIHRKLFPEQQNEFQRQKQNSIEFPKHQCSRVRRFQWWKSGRIEFDFFSNSDWSKNFDEKKIYSPGFREYNKGQ